MSASSSNKTISQQHKDIRNPQTDIKQIIHISPITTFKMRASLIATLATSAHAWTAALYDTTLSGEITNYYSLEGSATSEASAGCITLPGDIPGDVSYCKFFTGGGTANQDCASGSFTQPKSWMLRGGNCAVYHGGQCSGAVSGATEHGQQDVFRPESNFNSLKCWSV